MATDSDTKIMACSKCGSLDIRIAPIQEGGLPGTSEVAGRYYCEKCGKCRLPIIFDNETEYKKFLKAIKP